jgi:RecB family endonuclease NucS
MGRYKDSSVDPATEVTEEAGQIVFSLEKEMQIALGANFLQMEPGFTVADGGNERKTAAGWIDITAKDASGNTVVIELKAGTASPDAPTQVMAYVGAVAEEEGKVPRAMLVAQDFHNKVTFAASVIPGLQLFRYGFTFTFTPERKGHGAAA